MHHLESDAFNTSRANNMTGFRTLNDNMNSHARDLINRVRRPVMHLAINLVVMLAIAVVSFVAFGIAGEALAEEAKPAGTETVQLASYVRPNDMNMGGLLLPSKEPGQYVEAPRLATDVEISVNGPIARVSVTQRFENPAEGWVEPRC